MINPYSSACGNRMDIKTVREAGSVLEGKEVTVAGWVKKGRLQENNTLLFLELNDGSTPKNFQVVVKQEIGDINSMKPTGGSVVATGVIKAHPDQAKYAGEFELHATAVPFVGA